ncbi:DUF3413 domain-containing protein [Catenovulum maritimum]|uniref:Inner membrane protein YejM N-terminal domain-containing protein n=1 Tax=Catenovulum maritimum TaxID=1513271 RepID=A0A0J8JQF8_9ALTE|nr:DUF3413 domain-containing protein [Catenovulum maritimum]KMT66971.1 hypothetical protein XM47_02445 [Catenovulum maritimum]
MLLNSVNQTKSKLYSWGHWFSLTNALVGLLIAVVYWFSQPLPDTFLGLIYMLIYTAGHIPFLFFIGYLILVFPITLTNKPNIARPWAAFISALGLTILFIDALVFSANGYHINLLSLDYIQTDFQVLTASLPTGFKAALFVVFLAILFLQLILANALWRNLEKYRRWFIKSRIIPIAISCFVLGHLAHIWADLSLYKPIVKQDKLLPFSYPMTAKTILSDSGLVDLEAYNQKKVFSFDLSNYQMQSTQYQFSCLPANRNLSINVISLPLNQISSLELETKRFNHSIEVSKHWSPLDVKESLFEIMSGLPSIYQQQIEKSQSVLDNALLTAHIGLNIHNQTDIELPLTQSIQRVSSNQLIFNIAQFEDYHSALEYLKPKLEHAITIVLAKEKQGYGRLMMHGELISLPKITTNFDILPSILEGWLTCSFQSAYGKFGHNLYSVPNNQSWFVTANQDAIYVWHNQSTTTIQGNAQMTSINLNSNEVVEPPKNPILVRAINHLKHFLLDK